MTFGMSTAASTTPKMKPRPLNAVLGERVPGHGREHGPHDGGGSGVEDAVEHPAAEDAVVHREDAGHVVKQAEAVGPEPEPENWVPAGLIEATMSHQIGTTK